MTEAFFWWLTFLLLGLAALPITFSVFRNLSDRGYGFTRPLALLLFGYLFWILITVGALPNNRGAAIGVALIVLAISALLFRRRRSEMFEFFRRRWTVVLATELVFAAVFVIWAVLRSYSPAIAHTEQPMDFALLNGILSSSSFPPNDPWYAGESISYYYFGYLMSAGVTQLTAFSSSITYNLTLVSIAAMAATGVFSLVYNLVSTIRGPGGFKASPSMALGVGVLGVFLFMFMGNLLGGLEFLQAGDRGPGAFWDWLSVDGLSGVSRSSSWYPDEFWFWFRDTRVINSFVDGVGMDFTITEFPFFSFLLGDLHPHVMSLPFVVMAMALGFNVLASPGPVGIGWLRARPWEALVVVLALGGLGFLNSWDLPTFLGLFLAAMLLKAFHARAAGEHVDFRGVAFVMVALVVAAFALYLPFYLEFDSQASDAVGLPVVLPVRREMTRPIHLMLVIGPLLLLNLALLGAMAWDGFRLSAASLWEKTRAWLRGDGRRSDNGDGVTSGSQSAGHTMRRWLRSPLFWAVALPLIPFAVWAVAQVGFTLSGRDADVWGYELGLAETFLSIGPRFWHLLPAFIVLSLSLGLIFRHAGRSDSASAPAQYVLLMMAVAFFLLMGAELFHIPDVFTKSSPRMNTVFKFYYQAWTLLAVTGAVGVYWWLVKARSVIPNTRFGASGLLMLFALVLGVSFLYVPPAAYGKSERFDPVRTLDGTAAARRAAPDEFEAMAWLRENAGDDAVVVEAVVLDQFGRPTGDYNVSIGRISQRTGIPTVLGWPGHEKQWGRDDETIPERARDVDAIYRSTEQDVVEEALAKYGVTHVFVGDLERRTYGPGVAERIEAFMDIAYRNNDVVIYQTRNAP